MPKSSPIFLALAMTLSLAPALRAQETTRVLRPESFAHYARDFAQDDPEAIRTDISNAQAWDWMIDNVPFFECPDRDIEELYYFRWWSFRKHLEHTPAGWVITEFLPDVPWAGKYNTISCAAGFHLGEARWLRDAQYATAYARFWFGKEGEPRRYSCWLASAVRDVCLARGDWSLGIELLDRLVDNYAAWEQEHFDAKVGLFHQSADRDGMELGIGGDGYRPTINSYMFADAVAISDLARRAGRADLAATFATKAATLRRAIEHSLWNGRIFAVSQDGRQATPYVEELGLVPWQFGIPDASFNSAWSVIEDPHALARAHGIATAAPDSPHVKSDHDCQWNGPVWPYATSQTLLGLANVLQESPAQIDRASFYRALHTYAASQRRDGKPWVAEDLDGDSGKWIVDQPRSVYYNHSAYADLIVRGLLGLTLQDDGVTIHLLAPLDTWDYFCIDRLPCRGRLLSVVYDRTGARYGMRHKLTAMVDGKQVAFNDDLGALQIPLAMQATATVTQAGSTPDNATAPWVKSPAGPVLGGKLGTCFDICVLQDQLSAGPGYRMYFSWRPRKSVAMVESTDGVHWSEPAIALAPAPGSDWDQDVNRPSVVKRDGVYHLWYTSQSHGHSAIGYATSQDGKTFTRGNAGKPVLVADKPWEKVAVMCPDVSWDDAAKAWRMYYSGGEQYEPDAIGIATSADGVNWTKRDDNPIFASDPNIAWEKHKVTACQVIHRRDEYLMFYVGFKDVDHAQIGVARSRDGIHDWERLPSNPIVSPTPGGWDADACYKPFAIFDGQRWMLWYNGRRGSVEQIGLATHDGERLFAK